MNKEQLISTCMKCNPPQTDLQPPLPGFAKTHGICHEDLLLMFLDGGQLPGYLERKHTTMEALLKKYILQAKECKQSECDRA